MENPTESILMAIVIPSHIVKITLARALLLGRANPPKTWQEVNQISKDVAGKEDPLTGLPAHGYLDPLKGWGGFGFYFLENRAAAYAKHPNDPAWLFDPDTMKPRVNNPAWVQAIQDVMDLIAHRWRLSNRSD
jgi:multiple sugar transport system substrate-binding protein